MSLKLLMRFQSLCILVPVLRNTEPLRLLRSNEPLVRCGFAVKNCANTVCKHSRLVATEACRRARNGESFVNLVKRETGLILEIIDPAEEARLAVVSCAPHLADDSDQLLIVDIGGGTTDTSLVDLLELWPHEIVRARLLSLI